jgi:hypothetical protein
VTRRDLFLALPALSRAAAGRPLILLSEEEAVRIAKSAAPAQLERIRAAARRAMSRGPWSVTFHRPKGPPAGPHDFFSEGPYWWPDPKNPDGPYIRRDGVVNPGRFIENDRDLEQMSEAVMWLGLAAWLLNDRAAIERAREILRVWFLDEKTYMNPNLEFGQAIRGINWGRGIGIIDSRPFQWCVAGIRLLERANGGGLPENAGLRNWFARYVEWLTASRKGIEERNNGNNHATWWTAQVASYSVFCGNEAAEMDAYRHYREVLVPTQLKPDGSAPREEARTKSLGYSVMNLEAFSMICHIAQRRGHDLWSFSTPQGAGLARSVEYLAPFILEPARWTKPQITPFNPQHSYLLGLAGMGLKRTEWVRAQRRLLDPASPWLALVDLLITGPQP